jgi:hypothetical protein
MCSVSAIYDRFFDKWKGFPKPYDFSKPYVLPSEDVTPPLREPAPVSPITREEIDEFRRLLEKAREHDRLTGQPDCELEEKRERLRQLSKELGVEINFA